MEEYFDEMPLSKKRKVAAERDDEPSQASHVETAPEVHPTDTTSITQERRERFKALQARAVRSDFPLVIY